MRILAAVAVTVISCYSALSQTYTISTFAGGGVPVNVAGTSAFIATYELDSVAADKTGNLFFGYKDSVLRLDAKTGFVTRLAGTGAPGFGGDQGPAALAQFSSIAGVARDSAGNLYVADRNNNRVRRIANGIVTTIAGDGTQGFSGDNGPATSAQLNQPSEIAVDTIGNVYIADYGNLRVRKVSNGVISTVAGNGTAGFAGDGGPATDAQFSRLGGVAVDSAGNLYIADDLNGRIRKVSNGIITTFAGTGGSNGGPLGDNGPATSAYLVFPLSVATDAAGNLYLGVNDRIRKITKGVITTVAGTGDEGFSGDNGPATNAEMYNPRGISLDSSGNLYFVDSQNYRIRKVSNGIITTIVGAGEIALGTINGFSGDNGPVLNSAFSGLTDVEVASNGDVFIAADYRVLKISNGVVSTIAGNGNEGFSGDNGQATLAQLRGYPGLAADSAGNVYIGDIGHIRKVTNGIITTIAGNGTFGSKGDGGPATQAQLSTVSGIAVDRENNIYLSDFASSRIRKISNGVITTIAGTGVQGDSGDNGPAINAELVSPAQIALDSDGSIYVADAADGRVRKISNGIITTVAGNGTAGFSGDNGPALNAQLNFPYGVAVDSAGNVYIADSNNQRIRKVSQGIITTIAGSGSRIDGGDDGPATSAGILEPERISVDVMGNVYVIDGNYHIRILKPTGSSCSYSVTPAAIQMPAAGGSASITVQTVPSCAWSILGLPDWIGYSASSTGFNATVTVSIGANFGPQRTTPIYVAGTLVQVTQNGARRRSLLEAF